MLRTRRVYAILMKTPNDSPNKKSYITEQVFEVGEHYDGAPAYQCAVWKKEYYLKIFPKNTVKIVKCLLTGENIK